MVVRAGSGCRPWMHGALVGALCLAGCAEQLPDAAQVDLSEARTSYSFTDVAAASGVNFVHDSGARGEYYLRETNSGGGGFWDPDQDGDPDLLLLSGSVVSADGAPPSTVHYYENDGTGRFRNRTGDVGLVQDGDVQTFAVADVDGDGDLDLAVGGYEVLRLFVQQPAGRFRDATEDWGLSDFEGFVGALAWIDAAADARPDLAVGRYAQWSPDVDQRAGCRAPDGRRDYCLPSVFEASTLSLYRNDGRRLTDATEALGLAGVRSMALGMLVLDDNDDGVQDLFVANDGVMNSLLRGGSDGTFTDDALLYGLGALDGVKLPSGMGVDAIDPYGDGRLCIAVGNFSGEPVTLHCQMADGTGAPGNAVYEELSHRSGLALPTLPWVTFGVKFADLDLDGLPELVIANGHVNARHALREVPRAQPLQVMRFLPIATTGQPRMVDATPAGGLGGVSAVGRGLATADVDGDGDVDLLYIEVDGPTRLLRNDTPRRGRPLRLRLEASSGQRDGLGARVSFSAGVRRYNRFITSGGSYGGESERVPTFGIPDGPWPQTVDVGWAGGSPERFELPEGASSVVLRQGEATATALSPAPREATADNDATAQLRWALELQRPTVEDAARARGIVTAAVARDPDQAHLHWTLARMAMATGDLPEAAQLLRTAVERWPAQPTLQRDLALALWRLGDEAGARRVVDDSMASVDDVDYLETRLVIPLLEEGAAPLALAVIHRIAEAGPLRVGTQVLQAMALLALGEAVAAQSTARLVLDAVPGHAAAQVVLGYAAVDAGQIAEAESYFAAVIDSPHGEGETADALAGLSQVRVGQGRVGEGAGLFRQAAALRESPEMMFQAAELYGRAGDPEAARSALEATLALNDRYVPAIGSLGILDATAGDTAAALARFQQILELAPGHPLAMEWVQRLGGTPGSR